METIQYSNILQRLYSINLHGGMKLGLTNVLSLCAHLGNPERAFRSIHIAGTNGKGSVAVKIAKGLQGPNKRVGLFISPHISTFRERISINGTMIAEEDVSRHLRTLFTLSEKLKIPATFFEITTVLAFLHFAEQNIDFAVLETGLGGRLDATNVVIPLLTVITSIALEHTEILGSTLESIAKEKAGILKPSVPVILGPRAHCVIVPADSPLTKVEGTYPTFELENRAIAEAALHKLGVAQNHIQTAITASLPCRLEPIFHQGVKVWLDVAHNPDGLTSLFKSLETYNSRKKYRIICGISKSKDLEGCMRVIGNNASHVHLVEAPNGRGAPKHQLKDILLHLGMPEENISIDATISHTVKQAVRQASFRREEIVICGSFFIMCDARHALGIVEPRDPFDMNEK